jgi:hypothetical protein
MVYFCFKQLRDEENPEFFMEIHWQQVWFYFAVFFIVDFLF